MRRLATLLLACIAALSLLPVSHAAEFPDKPVALVVTFPPGGPAGVVAQALASEMKEHLGQPVIVEYRGGAGGNIGAEFVARAPPDGHTLLVGTSGPLAIHASLYRKLAYDPVRSFAPVAHLGHVPNLLLVHPSVPARDARELIAYAAANPGRLSFASSGNGTTNHLAGVLFASMAGIELQHVPYKGTGPALNDLLGGQVGMSFTDVLTALPHVKAGRLRALGMTSATRSQVLPEVPTLAEQGLEGYDISLFFAVVAPAGTPPDRVNKLNRTFAEVMASPKVRQQLASQGLEPPTASTPEELAKYITAQARMWAAVVRKSGAQLD